MFLHPFETYYTVRSNATENASQKIDLFLNKVNSLLHQVNSLSWLHVVWEKNFYSTVTLSPEDRSMTIILLQMYDHIDSGKRYNVQKDRKDPMVIATRCKLHHLEYTGFSLDSA